MTPPSVIVCRRAIGRVGALVCLLLPFPLLAAVDGQVINRTTNQPLGGAQVELYRFGEAGPQNLGSATTDAQGRFRFEQDISDGMHMLQVALQQVAYSKMLQPGAPSSGVVLEVFHVSPQPGQARVDQHMVLIEAGPEGLTVNESYILENPGNLTHYNPKAGTFRFYVSPRADGAISVNATAPGSIPLQRPAKKTARPNEYTIDLPIRPGQTRLDINYRLPAADPLRFEGKRIYPGGESRIVIPQGISIEGDGIVLLGQEPRTGAAVYGAKDPAYSLLVKGSGTLRPAAPEEDSGASLRQIRPRLYDRIELIAGLIFVILASGFLLLYRKGAPVEEPKPARSGKRTA